MYSQRVRKRIEVVYETLEAALLPNGSLWAAKILEIVYTLRRQACAALS